MDEETFEIAKPARNAYSIAVAGGDNDLMATLNGRLRGIFR